MRCGSFRKRVLNHKRDTCPKTKIEDPVSKAYGTLIHLLWSHPKAQDGCAGIHENKKLVVYQDIPFLTSQYILDKPSLLTDIPRPMSQWVNTAIMLCRKTIIKEWKSFYLRIVLQASKPLWHVLLYMGYIHQFSPLVVTFFNTLFSVFITKFDDTVFITQTWCQSVKKVNSRIKIGL